MPMTNETKEQCTNMSRLSNGATGKRGMFTKKKQRDDGSKGRRGAEKGWRLVERRRFWIGMRATKWKKE